MSELGELAPAEAPAPPAAEEKPKRRIWPVLAWGVIAAVVVTAGTVAALGTTGALIAGGCVAGTAVIGAVAWRLPQLRKHFAGPRRGARMRSMQSRTRRISLGGTGRKGKLAGLGLGKGKRPGGTGRKAGGLGKAAGKGRAGKGLLGRIGARLPGAKGRPSRRGGSVRGGPVGRGARRVMGAVRGSAARRQAAGKPSRMRRAATVAAVLPAAMALAGGKRIRKWIRKRRGKSDPPKDEKPADTPPEEPEPDPPPERKPGLPLAPNTTDHPSRRRHPVSHQLEDTVEAIHQGIGGFEPENVEDFGNFLQALPGVFEAVTSGLHRAADRFGDEFPIHPAVIEHLREMAGSCAGLFDYGNEAYGLFRSKHEEDLDRLENPRPGEEFMDVSKQ